jgi:molybdenum cofactor cytidylyltransferase
VKPDAGRFTQPYVCVYRSPVEERQLVLAAIVLAAGAGSRYSSQPGAKLLTELDGRPVLSHVLMAVREADPATTVVVLGHGAAEIERTIHWRGELRVINWAPQRGLASSLQAGIHALLALPDSFDGAFIVLGDQPRLRTDVLSALAAAAGRVRPADRPLVVPCYGASTGAAALEAATADRGPGPRNPVLLLRPAWSWVDELEGDRGLAPLIDRNPDQVLDVPVSGDMPDVDEPADLERLRAVDD